MELLLHQVLAGLATGGIYACLALAIRLSPMTPNIKMPTREAHSGHFLLTRNWPARKTRGTPSHLSRFRKMRLPRSPFDILSSGTLNSNLTTGCIVREN